MKRVLVTGATGFIGCNVVPLLRERGFEVHAMTRKRRDAEGIAWHEGDALDAADVSRIVEEAKPTHLLHLAWIATPGVYAQSPENERWLEASMHLFRECIRNGTVRIVGTGSSFEYDWNKGDCDERLTPLDATTPYGRKKEECGTLLGKLAEQEGISAAWARVFYLFGAYEPETKFMASVIRSLLRNEEVALTHGNQVRDFLYAEDVASAIVAVLESDVQGPVNVASGKPVTIKELVTRAARMLGKERLLKFGAKEAPPNEPARITAKTDRLSREVGWTERIGIERGLERTIEWWKGRLEAK